MSHLDQAAILVIGGMHSPGHNMNLSLIATGDPVLRQLPILSFPEAASSVGVLSPYGLLQWLEHHPLPQAQDGLNHLLIWAFSAGCVGAIGLAHYWHRYRGKILGFFAFDGWGVPLAAPFPIYRLSHDRFTHVTSQWLGAGAVGFYADPPIPHLQLWSQPITTQGWQTTRLLTGGEDRQRRSVPEFLCYWSRQSLIQAMRLGEEPPSSVSQRLITND